MTALHLQHVRKRFGATQALARTALKAGHLAEAIVGPKALARLSGGAWKEGMPKPQALRR